MDSLQLKPTHKAIKAYYDGLKQLHDINIDLEGSVAPLFAALLRHCAKQFNWILAEQYPMRPHCKPIKVDGALFDQYKLLHGIWEAKDTRDNLEKEVKNKFEVGYPKVNILFQAPKHAIIWQNGIEVINDDISNPNYLVDALKIFFEYQPPQFEQWKEAAEEFKEKVPELGAALLKVIKEEIKTNKRFKKALNDFEKICKSAINPNLSFQAVEEMLIQHILTERLFRKVFEYPDFTKHNIIAYEIEKVVTALTSQYFSRHDFLKKLDRFYIAIEKTASTIDDYTQKQAFLNSIYEKFFQGFSVEIADTHGIIYTPQTIVNFIVKSIEIILQKEFGLSLSDNGVHIIDPFVGTGNFIIRSMREIKKTALPFKYKDELHCNEVMLLPYYIASTNIEHEYYELTDDYMPFKGICLVDTFELAEDKQMSLFTEENTERVEQQKKTSIFVITGNPPYNVGQINENDNNKNRKYEEMDRRVRLTYTKDSKATNKNALSDVYVKAIKWASDRIVDNGEGIVAFITNNSFLEGIAFDGMRKHLVKDFSKIYHINLKGNARTSGERRRQEGGNIFDDAIRVSVGITFLIKKKKKKSNADIYLYSIKNYLKADEKREILDKSEHYGKIKFTKINPDKNHNWLTKGMREEFDAFLPIGSKEARASQNFNVQTIFKTYSNGVKTNRDTWVYNFSPEVLKKNIKQMIEFYNLQVLSWSNQTDMKLNVDDFVNYDDSKISWSRDLKLDLKRRRFAEFKKEKMRHSLYQPFTKQYLFFDKILNEEVYQFPHFLPTTQQEKENRIICVSGIGSKQPFHTLMVKYIPALPLVSVSQCFPLYVYNEEGGNKSENITNWTLLKFRKYYKNKAISKIDIFHYVYGLLHHPNYRERYETNLKRGLPGIPFVDDFWTYAIAGEKLANLHVNFEDVNEYKLNLIERRKVHLNWRVDKMKLSADKTKIIYNEFLTLSGIPPKTLEYRLGNRSALEWIIDQYRIKTNKRSNIVNDPNNQDDPQYIVRLIGKVINVSLKTIEIVNNLPKMTYKK